MKSPLLRLLRFLAPFWRWVGLAVVLGAGTIGASIGLMSASAWVIASAALHPSVAVLQVAIVGVRFFGISRGVLRYLERIVSHQVTFRLLARLRVWFYQALEPLAPARLMQLHSGDLLTRILGDIETLENFYVRVLAPPLVAGLVAIGAALFLGWYDPSLGVALLGLLLVSGIGLAGMARLLSQKQGRQVIRARSQLNPALIDGVQGLADLLALGQAGGQVQRLERIQQELLRTQRRLGILQALQNALGGLAGNLGMWVILVLAIPLVRAGELDGPGLAVVALAALASFEAVLPLPLAAQLLESSLEAARRLFQVVDTAPEVVEPPEPLPLPEQFSLEVKHLSFAYPGRPLALKDMNFRLEPGQWLALVGPSGSGKSTLLHLLLRFWEIQAGKIYLNDVDLRRFSPEGLRRQVGVVSQRPHLFNATLRDNLRIARPEASEADLRAALEVAQLNSVIQALPLGLDTWLGESGLRLSGGERQRLAVARAILKEPPLLLLDEATAHLDALTERALLAALRCKMSASAVILATHRLAGLEAVDHILVLDQGRLVEQGSPADLMAAPSLFRRMWEIQQQAVGGEP